MTRLYKRIQLSKTFFKYRTEIQSKLGFYIGQFYISTKIKKTHRIVLKIQFTAQEIKFATQKDDFTHENL